MKKILIFIFFSLSFVLFGQNDTHPNFTQSQLDSALNGTKQVEIPSHFNSNGDKNTWDIDLKDLGDVIKASSSNYSLSPLIVGVDTTGFILNKNGIAKDTVLLPSPTVDTDIKLLFSVVNDSIRIDSFDNKLGVIVGSPQFIDDVINKVDTTKWELGGNTLSLPKDFGTKTNTNIPLLLNNVNVGEFRTSDSFVNNGGTGLATSGNPRIRFGTSNYTDDDAAILIHRKIDGNLLFSHAIRDESEFETDGPGAYTPFDAAFTFKGNTPSVNHMGAFQSRNNYANSGTLNAMYSLTSRFNLNGGLVENLYDMYMFPIFGANQTYNNRYGVFMEYHTQPNTYFLYSAGPSPSYLGGLLQTAGDIISTGNITSNNVWSNNGFNSTGVGIGARTAPTAGFFQTLIGHNAGTNLTTSATLFNTYIGASSGFTGTTVNRNTYIGAYAGYLSTGSDNIFIGKDAGYNELGSNKLYISNSNTSTPLLGGDFSTQELKIGGVQQFSVQYPTSGAGVANGSIFYGTDGALYFKGGSGTVTQIAPN